MTPELPKDPSAPYCGTCFYELSGLTESACCPECGTPFVECLLRRNMPIAGNGRRYVSNAKIFGMPAISVAFGPHLDERIGHARGFLAIGDKATGVVAIGGVARGGVAVGGFAMGGVSIGGSSLGLISTGGAAIGGACAGGGAIGVIASGGGAIGGVASGGAAIGYYARGGAVIGPNVLQPGGARDPAAVNVFTTLAPYNGPVNMGPGSFFRPLLMHASVSALLLVVLALVAVMRDRREAGARGPYKNP